VVPDSWCEEACPGTTPPAGLSINCLEDILPGMMPEPSEDPVPESITAPDGARTLTRPRSVTAPELDHICKDSSPKDVSERLSPTGCLKKQLSPSGAGKVVRRGGLASSSTETARRGGDLCTLVLEGNLSPRDRLASDEAETPMSPSRMRRRRRGLTLPELPPISCFKPQGTPTGKRLLRRRVSFGDADEFSEAFTPYSRKYGTHPRDFYFDEQGLMVLEKSSDADLIHVKAADTIECVLDSGVDYHWRPQLNASFKVTQSVQLGEQILVKKRCGEWVQDKIGWLPLFTGEGKGHAFQVIVPKEELRYATPRVAVMSPFFEEESPRSQSDPTA